MLTNYRNYNFALKLNNFSPLSNSSLFCYTSKTRVRKHGYDKSWLGLFLGKSHPWLFLQSNWADIISWKFPEKLFKHTKWTQIQPYISCLSLPFICDSKLPWNEITCHTCYIILTPVQTSLADKMVSGSPGKCLKQDIKSKKKLTRAVISLPWKEGGKEIPTKGGV